VGLITRDWEVGDSGWEARERGRRAVGDVAGSTRYRPWRSLETVHERRGGFGMKKSRTMSDMSSLCSLSWSEGIEGESCEVSETPTREWTRKTTCRGRARG
jgi:hypothetical protein